MRQGAIVETTIDPVAQKAAWDALGGLTGAVVVTEPKTGRILAMVSKPGCDPNLLTAHDSGGHCFGHHRQWRDRDAA